MSKTIIVDIGHADKTGASGNGLEEHAVNVEIGKHLVARLEKAGLKVVQIDFPHEKNAVDLAKTVQAANRIDAVLGISLHSDSSDNAKAHGGHAEYNKGSVKGKRLATCVGKRVAALLPGRAEVVRSRPNESQGSLMVLRETRAVWVLVEGGFISNVEDAELMHNSPEKLAEAYAAGILDYLKEEGD